MSFNWKSSLDVLLTLGLVISFIALIIMREGISRELFIYGMFILVDIYVLVGLLSLVSGMNNKIMLAVIYIIVSLYGYYGMFVAFERWRTKPGIASPFNNFNIGFAFTLLVSKFVMVLGLVIQDIGRLILGLGQGIGTIITDYTTENVMPTRRKFMTLASAAIASVPLAAMLYGVTVGKYKYTIERLTLAFNDLPKSFKGFKVVQFSDAHSGSWDSIEKVEKGIQMINDLDPDIVVFTGDLVNGNKNEIDPFIDSFSKIKATHGKYAVLGNHDYYGSRESPEDNGPYWRDFFSKYERMGFDVIMNDNRTIHKNGETIKLLGVENWGDGRWFPKKGDLDRACKGCTDSDFSILLSHDPTHFDKKVVDHPHKVHLTLSGHTHGMQFGVKFKNFKWSPVQYRYKKWMGLYEDKDQYLYVNRGFGFLGFPGRVGMWPEITCITLEDA